MQGRIKDGWKHASQAVISAEIATRLQQIDLSGNAWSTRDPAASQGCIVQRARNYLQSLVYNYKTLLFLLQL